MGKPERREPQSRRRRLLYAAGAFLLLLLIGPFLVPVRPLTGLPQPAALADAQSRFVTVPFAGTDGVSLHLHEAGSGAPAFVLLHGFNYNLHSWDRVFDVFAAQGRVVAYDRLPFGLSERLVDGDWSGPNPYTGEAAQAQLLALLDELGISRAVLVGNSAGGQLAVEFALAHPARVAGLILVGPAIYRGGVPPWAGWLLQLPQVDHLGPLLIRRFGTNEMFNNLGYADPAALSDAARALSANTFAVANWDAALWEFNAATGAPPDLGPALPGLTLPVLIIQGEGDRIVPPEESVRAAEALPNASLVMLPGCGHFPQDECPQAFSDALTEWLQEEGARLGE